MFKCFMCGAMFPLDDVRMYKEVQLCKGCHNFYPNGQKSRVNLDERIEKARKEKQDAVDSR
jgi:ribosomal protein L31